MSQKPPSEAPSEPRPTGLRVAMALYGSVTYDSRVLREAETLSRAGHVVTIFCISGTPPEGALFRTLARVPSESSVLPDGSSPFLAERASSLWARLAGRTQWVVGYARNLRAWGRWAVASAGDVDVWHAHDLPGLMAIGPAVRRSCRLVYDSHEIFLEAGTAARLPAPLRRLLGAVERLLTRRAVALVTVNETIAEVLQRRLRPRRTIVVRNCPPAWDPPMPRPDLIRAATGIPADAAITLYHGVFAAHRGLEELAAAILRPGLERIHAVYLGHGSQLAMLEQMVADPAYGGRLHVLAAVPPDELLSWVASADVGMIVIQASTRNHRLSTPNKLFEGLAAGLPVVVSDFPGMHRIVLDDPSGPLGAVCRPDDVDDVARAIRSIVELPAEAREALRTRCLRAAHDHWNWETEVEGLLQLYADMGFRQRPGQPIDRRRINDLPDGARPRPG
jgi:glycosyltransferase involved in cell wall biosynthesis